MLSHLFCRVAEVAAEDGHHEVRLACDELHAAFEAPQAALAHADQRLRELVLDLLRATVDVP